MISLITQADFRRENMKTMVVVLFVLMLILTGCTSAQPRVQRSQLQIRQFQTRAYDTRDVKMIMKAVMNTLQDDGFIIKQANVDLGLLTAQKEVDVENSNEAFVSVLLSGSKARYKKNSIIEASANISGFGARTRVRINFQMKVMDNKGGVMKVRQVDDAKFYQDFFSKVDKAVFLAKENVE